MIAYNAVRMLWDAQHPLELERPQVRLVGHEDGATLFSGDRALRHWTDPLDALRWLPDSWSAGEISYQQPWIGYLSYDLGRRFERLPVLAADRLRTPLFIFGHTLEQGEGAARKDPIYPARANPLSSTFTRDEYLNAVRRAIDYIAAGDVFQVNLSQMFTAPARQPSLDVFRRLQASAASRYGAYLSFDSLDLISNSPELFLRVTPDRRVITRPIKGTRPRGSGMEDELRRSTKDQAELAMIVDLERNDLGRVCEVGSIRVTEPRVIEAHPTVYHGVATVEGELRADVTFVDLLRATFPGGSVTGAPKIRAMEIIEELEPVRRGPYCGAIGYLAADGTIEFNVAIRTMIVKDGLVHIPVGGGIVADSDPAAEYEETLVKARAMFDALGIVAPRESHQR
jgi:aminodeoxychorismate synthase component I